MVSHRRNSVSDFRPNESQAISSSSSSSSSLPSSTSSNVSSSSSSSSLISSSTTISTGMVVAVRVRPLSSREVENGHKKCVSVINNSIVAIRKEGNGGFLKSEQDQLNDYCFDVAFDDNSTQSEVYEKTTKKFIPNVVNGLNVTVFAYGATGAGKTHTMLGNARADDAASHADAGIIPQSVKDLFQLISDKKASLAIGEDYNVILTFIEVYNEQVYDLLTEEKSKVLSLREDQEKCVVIVAGVKEQSVSCYEDVMEHLSFGNKNRKTEATMANQVSSRSHAVMQLTVRHKKRNESSARETVIESKLSLIDLAGSERASATNNSGVRLQEGANINKSLLALANCINALALTSSTGKKTNVKYRDSKLTHLLKSSLEGNCNLVMIANVNPSNTTYEDSHNTLKYSNRAKNIKVNPTMKETKQDSTWMEREQRYKEENALLRKRIAELELIIEDLQNGVPTCKPQFIMEEENIDNNSVVIENIDIAVDDDVIVDFEDDAIVDSQCCEVESDENNFKVIEQDIQLEDMEIEQLKSDSENIELVSKTEEAEVVIEVPSCQKRKRDVDEIQTIEEVDDTIESNMLSDSVLEAGLFDEESVVISKPIVKGNKKRRGSFIPTVRGQKVDKIEENTVEPAFNVKKSDRVTDAVSPVPNPRPRRLLRSSISTACEDQENYDPNQLPTNKIVAKPQARRKSLAAVTALLESIELPEEKETVEENRRSTRSRGANVISGIVSKLRGKSIAPAVSENTKSTISSMEWLDI